ncbi:MAG TPA: LptA/OstA family protein [Acidobacteriaceae bacterium]|nr:LptA/OstA family protein [Acidobacteriaceae bacterium]
MRLSVERLRWGLLAGALLLIAVLVVLLSYGRYRAVQAWKQILARSGATITHETDGFTYSQALGKKQIFTLHAKHAIPHGQGKYTLQDGMLELYGPNGQITDRISGAQFEYDEKQGVARAVGEVDMEIEPPAALKPGANSKGKAAASQPIHVRTSGLTYVKKLDVAATDQDVEIDYAGMHGHARGAEFDSGQDVVHLLADVRVDGTLRGRPATLTAAKADLDRDAFQVSLTAPVLRSDGRTGSAGAAVLHIRKDGSLERIEASGRVKIQQETRTITAASLRAAMNERSQMKSAELAGGVALVDTNAERPMNGTAKAARVAFDDAGFATSAVLDGAVGMSMEDRMPGHPTLERKMGATDKVTLTMERVARPGGRTGGTSVSAVHAEGGAWANGDAVVQGAAGKASGLKKTSVAADDLRLTLADVAGKSEPQMLSGTGHTRIEEQTPDGTVETSTGDSLEARFAQQAGQGVERRGLEIASAEQTGNVRIRSLPGKAGELPSEGVAEKASLDGASNVLTLTGRPRLTQGDTSVTADTIRMMQQTGDAVADGSVAGTFVSANAKPGEPVTHALAAEAVLHKAAQTMELKGTDATPARMWQGASQVEAANLLLDRGKDEMQAWPASATGVVRSVFASAGKPGAKDKNASKVVRVTSARLNYSGAAHQAVFTGGVTAQAEDGTAQAQLGVAFLTPAEPPTAARRGNTSAAKGQPDALASSLERIVMSHGVKVEQPGRVGTGDELLYTAATGDFVLTGTPGHPPHIADDKQGSITGHTLLFHSPDSTIVVEGALPGAPGSQRVHTETTIKK